MKKSTKLLICCVAAAAIIFGGIAYVFRPLTFEQAVGGIKTESIERIELLNGTTGIVSQTIEPEDIEEIYGKIASVKLRAALPEKRAGWSYGIRIYVKNTDGYVSYTCNYGFNKYDGYKGNVKTLMYYMDDTDGVESVIAEYSAKLA